MNTGILFKTGTMFLAGQKKNGHWSGIGGKVEYGEPIYRAAVREALEEVFGVYDDNFTDDVMSELDLELVYAGANYVMYTLPLEALIYIAKRINAEGIPSTIFQEKIPLTKRGLVSKFTGLGELRRIDILDIRDYPFREFKLDKHFKQDLNKVLYQ